MSRKTWWRNTDREDKYAKPSGSSISRSQTWRRDALEESIQKLTHSLDAGVPSICQSPPLLAGRLVGNPSRERFYQRGEPQSFRNPVEDQYRKIPAFLGTAPECSRNEVPSSTCQSLRPANPSNSSMEKHSPIRIASLINRHRPKGMKTSSWENPTNSSIWYSFRDQDSLTRNYADLVVRKDPCTREEPDEFVEGMISYVDDDDKEINAPSESNLKEESSSFFGMIKFMIKMLVQIILAFYFIIICLVCLTFLANRGSQREISFNDLSNDIIKELVSSLHGQHIVLEGFSKDFQEALADEAVNVVTLFLFGPTGSGKSFTRSIVQNVVERHGFSVVIYDKERVEESNVKDVCSSQISQHLAIVMDGSSHADQSYLETGDLILGSKNCAYYKKILVIITSSLFSNEINNYMFSQCKFGDARLHISSSDVMNNILNGKEDLPWSEMNRVNHTIIPLLFLPLDMSHVKMCIVKELLLHGVERESFTSTIRKVIDEMDFYQYCGRMYSESGCKLVDSRVDYVINKE